MAELSPMMKQYFEIKNQNKDKILFFRLGDFYEMFYEDAVLASKELELTLTGRDCGQEERAPMCGVPFHSSEAYIARLISKGYKVAICEQVEDPALAKGLVKRDVIRVVTPGTVIESSMLQDDKNNYIASVYLTSTQSGICFADVSTGEIHTTVLSAKGLAQHVISELCRFSPSEILFNEVVLSYKEVTSYIKNQLSAAVELLDKTQYDYQTALDTVQRQFGQDYATVTDVAKDSPVLFALSALINYLEATQKKGVERLKNVSNYTENQYMQLSPVTRANLELCETMRGREKKGTLLWVLDKTATAMGKRLLRTYIEQPLVNVQTINNRLNGVEELYHASVQRAELVAGLEQIFDLERLMTRVVYGSAAPREIYALAVTCRQLPQIKKLCSVFTSTELKEIYNKIDELKDVEQNITAAIEEDAPISLKEGGVIKSGFSAEVDELRDIVHGGKSYLTSLETKLKEETGIPKLKIGYNRVFGYYIEVTRSYTEQVPAYFVRKQTLAGAERYITDELKQLENKILGANERLVVLERELFDELLKNISAQLTRIQQTATAVARLDVLSSFAEVAAKNNYIKPEVNAGGALEILEGRHPVVETMLSDSLFVPNSTALDNDNRVMIITGPNMAGKSTYMRQVALITLMAQIGSFVPAKKCTVGVVDSIFTRVGASDDLSAGQSTFMVEMTEVAEILNCATSNSLVILDEIGRGTSTFDGMSIARAVVEHIALKENGLGCKTLFATHYHELTALEDSLDGVKNYSVAVKKRGDDITFLRRIVAGPADDSYGIEVSKLAGLPETVVKRAKEVLKLLEASAPSLTEESRQLNFENFERFQPQKPSEDLVKKLREIDIDTLTPLEALSVLNQLKNSIN
ncbi:MAG: DNA mismatch repair protein MutS [Oscillospiraceae bacterium]|nr:DNA mismatch repair protein MutS [Oscillospiraceae bacterium]